ncbi:MAG: MFS transporter, partial [Armatimonadetes bacterium]|nr:MFS transporter [Armatimonadota bacterium]
TESDTNQPETNGSPSCPPYLLFVARMGCVTGVFGIAVARVVFPALGKDILHWSNSQIALVTSMALVGQAAAVLSTYISAWWRGRTWPQVALQLVMLFSGILALFTKSPIVFGLAFFLIGFAQGVAYTAALYHGIAAGSSRGKAGGIHESLMAGGHIIGNVFGGLAAQNISPTAPYSILSIMAGVCILVTLSAAYFYRKT